MGISSNIDQLDPFLLLQDFLRLGDNKEVDAETRNASILSFATLVYKTCSVKCSVDIVDKYTKIFLDRLTGTVQNVRSR